MIDSLLVLLKIICYCWLYFISFIWKRITCRSAQ